MFIRIARLLKRVTGSTVEKKTMIEQREMTPEEEKAFNEVFVEMDKGFEHFDKAFDHMNDVFDKVRK